MVAFCAIYIIQSISRSSTPSFTDWDVYRVALLQELVAELESQAQARHQLDPADNMIVVEAMARRLSSALGVVIARRSRLARTDPSLAPVPDGMLDETRLGDGGQLDWDSTLFAGDQQHHDPAADMFNFSLDGPLHFVTDPAANTFLPGFDFSFPLGVPQNGQGRGSGDLAGLGGAGGTSF